VPQPSDWLGDYILFSKNNLWRVAISPDTWKISGKPEPLTTGSASEFRPRVALQRGEKWRIVFSNLTGAQSLWSLPIGHNTASVLGQPVKLMADAAPGDFPSISKDGTRFVYRFSGLEGMALRLRDMTSGTERTLVDSGPLSRPRISPDGSTVAYNPSDLDAVDSVIRLVSTSGGESSTLGKTCGLIYDWSPDGKKIIYRSGSPMRFSAIDVASGEQAIIAADPKRTLTRRCSRLTAGGPRFISHRPNTCGPSS
jgi:hypothetical protein